MLGTSSRCLFKGRPPQLSSSIASGSQSVEVSASHALRLIAPRPRSFSIQQGPVTRTFRKSIHAVSYFDFSRPDFLPSRRSSSDADATLNPPPERYVPPIPNVQFLAQTEPQRRLAEAIQQHDSDASWDAYVDLGEASSSLPRDVLDLLIVLQCRKRLKTTNRERGKQLMTQTCDRILQLCRDRQQCQTGGSLNTAATSANGLAHVSPSVALRLLYLLVVEEEQKLQPTEELDRALRPDLVQLLTELARKVEHGVDDSVISFDISLRGRLVSTFARLSETALAVDQLQKLVDDLVPTEQDTPDPRPFELLLSKLTEQAGKHTAPETLPSPVDANAGINLQDPLLQTLHLTLRSRAEVYNQVLHRSLDTLDSHTLAWLLPLQPSNTVDTALRPILDDRSELEPRWHPWQTSAIGTIVSTRAMEAFGDRVAFVLAKRGILQPVLYILQTSKSPLSGNAAPTGARQDLFEIALHQVAGRMRHVVTSQSRKTSEDHLNLVGDLRLVTRIYDLAAKNGVELTANIHRSVIHAFSACTLTSIANLGNTRLRYPQFPESLAQLNEKQDSKKILMQQLRRFTATILAYDHDLNGGSLDYASHATLFGLHLRVRDFDFSKRVYQLLRLRESRSDLWTEGSSESLYKVSLHHSSAPDRSSFGWFFVESMRASRNAQVTVQLYLDWIASGNVLSSRLSSLFMQYLLSIGSTTIAHRVLQEMQDARVQVPRRLARAFVTSFADAGFPEFAVEIASVLTSEAMTQNANLSHGQTKTSAPSTVLGSRLQILSIALDRASKADVPWTAERQKGMLRLFDDFRIGLTHQIMLTKQDGSSNSHIEGNITFATRKHVRFAYNAAMRSHVALQPSVDELPRHGNADDTDEEAEIKPMADRVVSEASRDEIKHLLQELQDLGVEPDSDTWTIQLLTILSQTVPGEGIGRERVLEAVQIFMKSTKEVFVEQSVPILYESDAKSQHSIPVQVHPRAVSELIHHLLKSGETDLASDVYSTFQASQKSFRSRRYPYAQYFLVETAHLYILAAQGRRNELEDKIAHLQRSGASRDE